MYNGYLIRVGNYTIPHKYIGPGYKPVLNGQDMDSYRDANGYLHRNALEHSVPKIDFNTPYLYEYQFNELMAGIRSNFINDVEKNVSCSVYIPFLDDYVSCEMYLVDPEPSIYAVWGNRIIYNQTRIAFVAY